ncbi:hypothetical protein A5886_000365 [Enterococcus sp. 8G7_MSG3316]|uniref:YlbF family regulator n=1 Tax=Candidatus Enterococcus testudinis TaxID=1834191 RepID=A0A242A2N5_9ENTE|nr:hypothetical protein A5886_000365 [Enterococcus sp. 8G7_MSG3316]
MDQLEKEPKIASALATLKQLLADHSVVRDFQEIQQRALENPKLQALEEAIKQAQKEMVQYEHYEKPEAAHAARLTYETLTKEYDAHPIVVAYRVALQEADDLLHYVTIEIQKQVNMTIQEEEQHASED